jgi:hypothetical protein
MTLHAGDWVEVRSKEEILATLDKNGRLDGLPLMPQMFNYCGQRFQVYKRAHKTCDTVSGDYKGRLLPNGIHLDLRCDGKAYGGCQAGCLIFWKEAWLRPVDQSPSEPDAVRTAIQSGCTEADVIKATQAEKTTAADPVRYVCQATELLNYTQPLQWWDARQYVEDYTSGNASITRMLCGFLYFAYTYGTMARRRTLGRPARWIYDKFQSLRGGLPFPRHTGKLASGKDAPVSRLNLQPGELVRVRSYKDILATVDTVNFNRGMNFDAEMVPDCGKTFRVRANVDRFVDERTGLMRQLKTPAVILEGAHCRSRYSECRLFCPRSIYTWWREIWLERVGTN